MLISNLGQGGRGVREPIPALRGGEKESPVAQWGTRGKAQQRSDAPFLRSSVFRPLAWTLSESIPVVVPHRRDKRRRRYACISDASGRSSASALQMSESRRRQTIARLLKSVSAGTRFSSAANRDITAALLRKDTLSITADVEGETK